MQKTAPTHLSREVDLPVQVHLVVNNIANPLLLITELFAAHLLGSGDLKWSVFEVERLPVICGEGDEREKRSKRDKA